MGLQLKPESLSLGSNWIRLGFIMNPTTQKCLSSQAAREGEGGQRRVTRWQEREMSTAARSREGGTSQRKDEDMAAMGAYGDKSMTLTTVLSMWRRDGGLSVNAVSVLI